MKQDDVKKTQNELENQTEGNPSGKKLVFDPATGEVVFKDSYKESEVVVDQMNQDGYF